MLRETDFVEGDWTALGTGKYESLALSRKGKDLMRVGQINRLSSGMLIGLAPVALAQS